MKNKHLNYFKAVSDKLLAFLDQIKDKSIKMSNQLTHFIDDDTLRDKRWVNRSDMHAESSFGKHNIDYTTAVDN